MADSDKRGSGRPDIEFGARIDAKELRFGEVPETSVEFFGTPGHESEHGDRRTNLPDEVEAGKTYRNVRVDYRLSTKIAWDDDEDGPG
jgi:hypothetical protein